MKKYAKVINEETKACEVGVGTNTAFYKSIGMKEQEVEQAWDGAWYLLGYAPKKPEETSKEEIRAERDELIQNSDKYMLVDFPITEEEREKWVAYRQYLRDYTKQENWWEESPKTFEDWK